MRIIVTQDDITYGTYADCKFCPVARAIRRATGESQVEVGNERAYLGVAGEDYEQLAVLPLEAQQFIDDFDHGRPVQPLEFELTFYNYGEEPDDDDPIIDVMG